MSAVQVGNGPGRKHPLEEIEESTPLKLHLQHLEKEEDIARQRVDRKENRRSSTQNEIYQLFALYFVFQGVVLSALYQANNGSSLPSKHICQSWWVPFSLSLITSLATIAATLQKLYDHGKIEKEVEDEKADARVLFYRIQKLRQMGKDFDLDSEIQRPRKIDHNQTVCGFMFSPGLRTYTATVTLVLILFSGITLVACKLLLCGALIRT